MDPHVSFPEPNAAPRIAAIEWLRLLAMFEIVAFHTGMAHRLPWLGGFGLPTFLLLGAAFSVLAADRRGARSVLSRKLRTLGGAWVFWTLLYAALLALVAMRRGQTLGSVLHPEMIVSGVRTHMWFAPFAVFAGGVSAGVHVFTRRVSRTLRFVALLALGYAWILVAERFPARSLVLWQWSFSLPSIPLGMALAELLRAREAERTKVAMAVGAFCALALATAYALPEAIPVDAPSAVASLERYALSLAAITAIVFLPLGSNAVVARIAPYMLGVYFCHVAVIDVLRPVLSSHQVLASLVVFAASVAVVEIVQRTRLQRYVVMTPSPVDAAVSRIPKPP